MNERIHILCVLNPSSGNGLGRQRWPSVESLLKDFDISHELFTVDNRPLTDAVFQKLLNSSDGEYDLICGIGGDGTHSQIINGFMRFRAQYPNRSLPPYAMIPLGTGNDIAKSFGLTARENIFVSDLHRSVAAIRHGADYYLDIGRMGDLYFVDALTIGLDPRILEQHNRYKNEIIKYPLLRRLIRGNILYTYCMGLRIWDHNPIEAGIIVDGNQWYSGPVLNLIINNTRIYGGEFVICPDSFANDGLFEVVVFAGQYDYLARYFLALRNNPREIQKMAEKLSRVSSCTQGKNIRISLSRREAVQYDGEMLTSSDKFDISVIPRAIQIKIPAE
jgi:YegS/Rv2252/BmrU family lipid kinase